jgi:hypothetical protein
MKRYQSYVLAAAAGLAMLEAVGLAVSTVQAAPLAPCEMRLRVELSPAVPNPREPGFVSSLLGNHPQYRLSLQGHDLENPSVIALDLAGPGAEADCGQVVKSMRKDGRVVSVEVEQDEASAVLLLSSTQSRVSEPATRTVQPLGTMRSEPDGDWVLEPLNGVSFARVARDRYECDTWAVDQTGFDPTTDDGGVPPDGVTERRMEYLRAEAACFQAHGYLLK